MAVPFLSTSTFILLGRHSHIVPMYSYVRLNFFSLMFGKLRTTNWKTATKWFKEVKNKSKLEGRKPIPEMHYWCHFSCLNCWRKGHFYITSEFNSWYHNYLIEKKITFLCFFKKMTKECVTDFREIFIKRSCVLFLGNFRDSYVLYIF